MYAFAATYLRVLRNSILSYDISHDVCEGYSHREVPCLSLHINELVISMNDSARSHVHGGEQ